MSTGERVTRKGRLLARQERHDEQTAPSIPLSWSWSGDNKTTTTGKSSLSSSCDETAGAHAANRGTVFFQHPVVYQPGRPTGSGYWQLSEREARQARLDRHRREAQEEASPHWPPSGAPSEGQFGPPHPASMAVVVVTGELMDPPPKTEEDSVAGGEKRFGKRDQRRLCICVLACCVLVALIVGIVVPLVVLKQSIDADESVVEPPLESVPTSRPSDQRTLSPSMTPRGSSFVPFGDEYVGEQAGEMLGQSLAFVGDRWVAVGSPGHNGGDGLVRVWDVYNGTQIGQDIFVSHELVTRLGRALSAEGGFLAVGGFQVFFLIRYNETARSWMEIENLPIDNELRSISIDASRITSRVSDIRLTLTYVEKLVSTQNLGTTILWIDTSPGSEAWGRQGESMSFKKASMVEVVSVGETSVVASITWGADTARVVPVQAYAFNTPVWGRQPRFDLPESVTGGSRLLCTAYFRKAYSTVIAYANVEKVTVVEVRADLSVTQLGSPIVFAGQDEPFGTDLAVSDGWLAVGRIVSGDLFVRMYRFEEEGDWFQQGNEIRIGMAGDRVSVAMGAQSLHRGVVSPTVAVGLPRGGVTNAFVRSNTTVIAAGKARLFRRTV